MFIDIHCHLDLLKDINKAIERAEEREVEIIITNGINVKNNREVLKLAEENKNIKAAIGIYPIDALELSDSQIDEEIEFIKENKDKIIAIGEVGMDFKESADKERQKTTFEKFIRLAKQIDKPIIVHSRKAEKECIEALERLGAKKVILHYFSGNFSLAERAVKNSWFLSIPTAVYYSEHFQKIAKELPLDNLLCETDSPFSHPMKQGQNEPSNVIYSYKKIALLKGIPLHEVEEKIEENFSRLFSK